MRRKINSTLIIPLLENKNRKERMQPALILSLPARGGQRFPLSAYNQATRMASFAGGNFRISKLFRPGYVENLVGKNGFFPRKAPSLYIVKKRLK
jgi:hypothetical protein